MQNRQASYVQLADLPPLVSAFRAAVEELRPGEVHELAGSPKVFRSHNVVASLAQPLYRNSVDAMIRQRLPLYGSISSRLKSTTAKITADHVKGLQHLARDHPEVGQRIVVSLERKSRCTEDDILILPAIGFCIRLAAGDWF